MNFVNLGKHWPLRLLVLLMMLSAQSFSLAHEQTHSPFADNGIQCEVCSASQGQDTCVTVTHVAPITHGEHKLQVTEPRTDLHRGDSFAYIARAPPLKYVI